MHVLKETQLEQVQGGVLPLIALGAAVLLGGCATMPKRPDPPPSDDETPPSSD